MPSDTLLDVPRDHLSDWDANASLAAQLERAKEDLELTAYAVSHDLKAPLRAIVFACEELSEIPDISGNEKVQVRLASIAHESVRMKTLMQGLLDYLNLETFGPTRTLLDSREIVETALTLLEDKIRTTGAKITYGAMPEVYGHRGRLTRLFVNILDNALKFSGPVPLVHIVARGAIKKHFVEFSIEDNGIGIDNEHRTIIFQLFQRLHPAGEYPGEGIGLALCRKIVESHGGKLCVEPAAEKGSRFCFTLPTIKTD